MTCDSNVPKPAKLLNQMEIIDSGIPAVVTTPAGGLIGNRIAKETNEQANEINAAADRFWGQAQADL